MAAASNGMLLRIHQGYAACLLFLALFVALFVVLPAVLLLPAPLSAAESAAETASFQIKYIPLEEAKDLAQTQLSANGRLSTLASRSLLIAVDKRKNIENIRAILQQFDAPAPRLLLNLQVLAVSSSQSRLWAAKGQPLAGGWMRIANPGSMNPGSIKHQLMASKEAWLRSNSETRLETGGIRPIRLEIREWLEQHGVPDSPDLGLRPITAGLALRIGLQNNGLQSNGLQDNKQVRLELNPWIRLTQQQQVAAPAHVEVLPDLGTTAATLQPPSTIAPIRLNIQPDGNAGSPHYIAISAANTEIDIPVGETVTLLASQKEARALGDALLSKTINGKGKLIILRLLLEQAP